MMAVDSRSESTESPRFESMKKRYVGKTRSRLTMKYTTLLWSLIAISISCFVGGAARAADVAVGGTAASAGQCEDIVLANGLATANPAAASEAHARAEQGDFLAQGLLTDQEFSQYLDSHGWHARDRLQRAGKIRDGLISAARHGYPGASLTYYRIMKTNYYRDKLVTIEAYARLEAKDDALAASKGAKPVSTVRQLQLRADLQAATRGGDIWLSPTELIRRVRSRVSGPCGSLYADELGVAYYLGIGVSYDLGDATAWFGRAAQGGLVAAEYQEATVLLKEHARCDDNSLAFRLLTEAAFNGYVKAWVLLGRLRNEGLCAPSDPGSAEQYYEEAARRGSADGTYLLGLMLARDVSSPVRWARGIALISQSTRDISSATWALSGVEYLYAAFCGNDGDLPQNVRSRLLRSAAELGITPVWPPGTTQRAASPTACSLARDPIAAGLGPLYGRVMKDWIHSAGG